MVIPPRKTSPAPPAALSGQAWAVLALLALAEEGVHMTSLLAGARALLPAIGLPGPADEATLQGWLVQCQAAQMAILDRWAPPKCVRAVRDPVLLHAWRQGWSEALGKAFRSCHGSYNFTGYPCAQTFRVTLFTDSFKEFADLLERHQEPRSSPLAVLEDLAEALPRPLDAAWLNHLPAEIGHLLAWALLNQSLQVWAPIAPLVAWLEGIPDRDADFRLLLTECLLYQERFAEAAAEVRRLHPGSESPWPVHLAGLADFLQDRTEPALGAFEAAWEGVKASNRRIRRPLLPGPVGWFHALGLLRHGQADKAERLAKVYGGRDYNDRHSRVWNALLDMAVLAQGRKLAAWQGSRREDGPMHGLIQLHGLFWMDPRGFRATQLGAPLEALATLAERSGIPWLARQICTLQGRWQGEAGDGGAALADYLAATPSWRRVLDSLARLGQERPAAKAPRPVKPRRLAWILDYRRPDSGYEAWELQARDQRQGKDGAWSVGKAIPLSRIRSACATLDFLTSADQRAIEAAGERAYHSREDIWKILYALAGHEALFIQAKGGPVPLQVRAAEPELRVQDDPDGLHLLLHPNAEGAAYGMREEAPDRLVIYAYGPRHREIAALLGAKGLRVPLEARPEVAKAVASLTSLLPVHSDLPLGALAAGLEEVPADPMPELDLRSWGDGLRAAVRVWPMAGGPAFVPGAGAGELLLEVAGRPCRTLRDLPREVALARALADRCPSLGGGWDWELEEPLDCLELLLQLEPLKGQVRLAWPEGERFRTPQVGSVSRLHLGLKGEGQWFTLEGHLRLDQDRILDLQELLRLLPGAKGDFVPLGEGAWLRLERRFRERLEGLRSLAVPHGGALRLAPAAALGLAELSAEAADFRAPRAWKDRAKAIQQAISADIPVPATLGATLRPYQEEGFIWLARLAEAGLGACLADDMGLGKTIQALGLLLRRAGQGPALVVAPTSVVGNWAAEAARFAPTLEVRVFGEGDRAATLESAGPSTLVLCSYGLLVQEQEAFAGRTWATVILDEAQAIKNADTQRSRAVMALDGGARVAMSGTPVENHLGELWNLFRFLNPGLLGGAEHFTRTFAGPIERDRDRPSLLRLKRLLNPFLLRRTKQEVAQELPAMTEIVHRVTLSADERAFYEILRRRALDRLEAEPGSAPGQIQILAELMRLRRACCAPSLVEAGLDLPSAKSEAFLEILGELRENRHKALVFSQFVDHLSVIRGHLERAGVPYQYLDGGTPAAQRRRAIDAFQAGEGDLFLISLKAGGTGLNLTAADYVIHLDPWWNPAVEDQASGRAHRIGQGRPVTVYRLVAADTIEEKILELHRVKRELADGILEGTGSAALSAADLLALLRP